MRRHLRNPPLCIYVIIMFPSLALAIGPPEQPKEPQWYPKAEEQLSDPGQDRVPRVRLSVAAEIAIYSVP